MVWDLIISGLAGCGVMAWILWMSALWLRYQESKPTRRQENQQRTVKALAELMVEAPKTGTRPVLPGKEWDDVKANPCKRPRRATRQK